jgi:hypothetical protein
MAPWALPEFIMFATRLNKHVVIFERNPPFAHSVILSDITEAEKAELGGIKVCTGRSRGYNLPVSKVVRA